MVDKKMQALALISKHVDEGTLDLPRELLKEFIEKIMGTEADALCGASYGERSDERVNQRNGYRTRPWDTRVGTIDLEVPKLRKGSYFPHWLLEPRKRAERALAQVVAESYVLGGLDSTGRQAGPVDGGRWAVEVGGLTPGGRPR